MGYDKKELGKLTDKYMDRGKDEKAAERKAKEDLDKQRRKEEDRKRQERKNR